MTIVQILCYKSINCSFDLTNNTLIRLLDSENTFFDVIKDNLTDLEEQRKAVNEVAVGLINISEKFVTRYILLNNL